MSLSNKDICALLISEREDGRFQCSMRTKSYSSSQSYTNLFNHLKRDHPTYEADAREAVKRRNRLGLHVVDQRTRDIFRWLELLIMERLPFSFVERKLARLNTNLSTISEETVLRYLCLVAAKVEVRVACALPDKFGLVFDGWSEGGRHFVGIFAVYDNGSAPAESVSDTYFSDLDCTSREFVLLAFSPLDNKEDLSAQSHVDLIADTLTRYNKPWDSVVVMTGDNCAVNQYISNRRGGIPFVMCASHRFNLAVTDYLKEDDRLIAKVNTLMTKLRSIKGRAILSRVYDKATRTCNVTRWSSTYAMLDRYADLEPSLSSLGHGVLVEFDIQPLLLCRSDKERVKSLLSDMKNFEAVTKTLQKTTLAISGARRLFDHVVKYYPAMKNRLGTQARIVNYPEFESGIVKLQRHETLSASERNACIPFKAVVQCRDEDVAEPSFVASAFMKRKAPKRTHVRQHIVHPTNVKRMRALFFNCETSLHRPSQADGSSAA